MCRFGPVLHHWIIALVKCKTSEQSLLFLLGLFLLKKWSGGYDLCSTFLSSTHVCDCHWASAANMVEREQVTYSLYKTDKFHGDCPFVAGEGSEFLFTWTWPEYPHELLSGAVELKQCLKPDSRLQTRLPSRWHSVATWLCYLTPVPQFPNL